ncbi:MAG: 16S rRNA (uracil(1498)-N(3))-methyltransferase [Simkania sp.]|nr:16S rRNA (uracil(1498)-N(3))-methyltransferase [Simkania sp.]
MPAERFFTHLPFTQGATIFLEGTEAFHLVRVMRARVGDEIELVNGKGQLAQATLKAILKEHAELTLGSIHQAPMATPSFILCIALPRFPRLEWIIEKGTELGADAFYLFPGELSEKTTLSTQQVKRLHLLSIAALKQCGRLDLPEVVLKPPLSQWDQPPGVLLFGDTCPGAPLLSAIKEHPVLFFSGPEAGFSSKELRLFAHWQAQGVSLHRNILRADTAPIAAAAILSTYYST